MKRVLLRVDFNVPLKNGKVADDFRIRASLPTIQHWLKDGAQVFLIAHLEYGGELPHLDAVRNFLDKSLGFTVGFMRGKLPDVPEKFSERVVLFDNIRLNPGEKDNDPKFARALAAWGDYYVNDAFADSHREHASIVLLPKLLPHEAGLFFQKEVENLSKFFKPQHPFLFILGGKKFETKEPLISRFLRSADAIFVGGALVNTFLSHKGYRVGGSPVEGVQISRYILTNHKILLPEDIVLSRGGKKKTVSLIPASNIERGDLIYDAGPKTIKILAGLAKEAKFILWNGTLGVCEKGFTYGTRTLAKKLGESKAFKVVGGGDTVAAIRKFKLEKNFDFISTGGGAMLEFLAKGTLPGIEALKKH